MAGPRRQAPSSALPVTALVGVALAGVLALVGAKVAKNDARERPLPALTAETPLDRPSDAGARGRATVDASASGARPFNVVLITIDTLRADLGFSGYPRPVTPNIDALAARSAVFERAYALASYTPKSVGPLMIGRYVSETARSSAHYTRFYPSNVLLAERVQDAGGATLGAASHHYFWWKSSGLAQGMDRWDMSAMPPNPRDDDDRVTSDRLSDAAIRLLGETRTEASAPPFFAWFHYMDPHAPYVRHAGAPDFAAMAAEDPRRARDGYDEEVWFTDQQVGRVLDFIARQPWASATAILLTADHGEAFGEHGHWKHGRELWEPLVKVPLVIHVPGGTPRRLGVKRSHVDLAPTVLELMGIASPAPELRGRSLVADLDAASPEERDVFIDMSAGPFNEARRAVITGPSPGLKLIDFGPRRAVFDLASDAGELAPLAEGDPRTKQASDAFARALARLESLPALP